MESTPDRTRQMSHHSLIRIHKRLSQEYGKFEKAGYGVKPVYAHGPGDTSSPTQRYLVALHVCHPDDWASAIIPPTGKCFSLNNSDKYGPHNGRVKCCNEKGGSRWWGSHYDAIYSTSGKFFSSRSCESYQGLVEVSVVHKNASVRALSYSN